MVQLSLLRPWEQMGRELAHPPAGIHTGFFRREGMHWPVVLSQMLCVLLKCVRFASNVLMKNETVIL